MCCARFTSRRAPLARRPGADAGDLSDWGVLGAPGPSVLRRPQLLSTGCALGPDVLWQRGSQGCHKLAARAFVCDFKDVCTRRWAWSMSSTATARGRAATHARRSTFRARARASTATSTRWDYFHLRAIIAWLLLVQMCLETGLRPRQAPDLTSPLHCCRRKLA